MKMFCFHKLIILIIKIKFKNSLQVMYGLQVLIKLNKTNYDT